MWILEDDLIYRTTQEKILRKDARGNWEEVGTKTVPIGIPLARVIKSDYGNILDSAIDLLKALELAFNSGFLPEGDEPYEAAKAAINKAKGV